MMRNTMLALLAVAAAGAATMASSGPAAARDYPYCLRGGGYGYTGDCTYTSYGQCLASASGRTAWCDVNPLFAFGEQRRARPSRYY
jgi:hypothetical protein